MTGLPYYRDNSINVRKCWMQSQSQSRSQSRSQVLISNLNWSITSFSGVQKGVKAFAEKFKTLELGDFTFPEQLKKRGFDRNEEVDGVKGYFFRDDGFQLWDALFKWVLVHSFGNSCFWVKHLQSLVFALEPIFSQSLGRLVSPSHLLIWSV